MIPLFKTPDLGDTRLVTEVLASGMLSEGPRVAEFTERLKTVLGHPRPLCLNSCTSAMTLALELVGSAEGSVLVSPFTMIATSTAVAAARMQLQWVDADPTTFCMDLAKARAALHRETQAVLITCVGGLVPHGLAEFVQGCPVPVVLDCAHAVGTYYQGRHLSTHARAACFSFQGIKHLTTGDGGALCVHSDYDYERAERLKWFGLTRQMAPGVDRLTHQMTVDVPKWGYKYNLNDPAAAIGLCSLGSLPTSLQASAANAAFYQTQLADVPQLRLPQVADGCEPGWWTYGFLAQDRDRLLQHLRADGIDSSPLWRRSDTYASARSWYPKPSLPGVDEIAAQALFIPCGYWVDTVTRQHIVERIREFYQA